MLRGAPLRGRASLIDLNRQPRMAMYVLTQGVRALVRRDRRWEFLAPGVAHPGDSGGTAPDFHRLPLVPPHLAPAVHHAPGTAVNLQLTCGA